MKENERALMKYGFGFGIIALGLLLEYLGLGYEGFTTFGSVGKYLIYVGLGALIITTVTKSWKRKRVVDERMEFVAAKAMRITFQFLVIAAASSL